MPVNTSNPQEKVLIVATVASTISGFLVPNIRILQRLGYTVEVAANFEPKANAGVDMFAFIDKLADMNVAPTQIDFTRSAADITAHSQAYRQIRDLMAQGRYAFVHTNTPIASALVRMACHETGTRCMYTAHGFHFFDGAPLANWALWYPVERRLSRYTDVLITINREDYARACSDLHAAKTIYIPGVGIDTEAFRKDIAIRESARSELKIPDDAFVLLSVGELNANKNHEIVIHALGKLKRDGELQNTLYLIAGEGADRKTLVQAIRDEGLVGSVRLLGQRPDIERMYNAADAFVFPSHREGLPVSLMEAMACELPVACSAIRGNTDLVDGQGGFFFDPSDQAQVAAALVRLLCADGGERSAMGTYNRNRLSAFALDAVAGDLERIYAQERRPAHILVNYTGRRGGGPLDAFEITRALVENGNKVSAVVSSGIENLDAWKALDLAHLVVIDTYSNHMDFALNSLTFFCRQAPQIRNAFAGETVDYIYCPMGAFWAYRINKLFPHAVTGIAIHDPMLHSGETGIKARLIPDHYDAYDLLFVHSKRFVDYVRDAYGKQTHYLALGRHDFYKTCVDKRSIVQYDPEKVNFVFFGRISQYKGLDVLAQAYRKVADYLGDKVTLTVIGNGDFSEYEERYSKLPTATVVNRWIADEEVESAFTGKNLVCICPYVDATQSGVIFIAMDYGVPVVATRTGGIVEQIEDGITGLLVEPGNAEELARAMRRLAQDEALRARISANELRVIKEYDWRSSATKLVKIYNDAANK